MPDADPYLDLVNQAERAYQALIADPDSTVYDIREAGFRASATRKAYAALKNSSTSASTVPASSPGEWRELIERQVAREVRAPGFDQQLDQVKRLGRAITDNPELLKTGWPESQRGPDQPWFYQNTPELRAALTRFDAELQDWARQHTADVRFVGQTPQQTLHEFILARPEPFILLRLTQTMPWDVEADIQGLPGFVTAAQRLDRGLKSAHARGLDRSRLPPVPAYRDMTSEFTAGYVPNYAAIDRFLGLDNDDKDKDKDKPPTTTTALAEESYWKPLGTPVPLYVTVLDAAFTCIPYVGNVYAGLEIATGYNAFGFELSKTEKAILAGAILLPYGVGMVKLVGKGGTAAVKVVAGGAEVASEVAVKTATEGLGEAGAKVIVGGQVTEAAAKTALDTTAETVAKTEAAAKMAAVGVDEASRILLTAAEDIAKARSLPWAKVEKALQVLQAFAKAEPRIIGRLTPQAAKLFLEAALKHPQLEGLSAEALSRVLQEWSAKTSTGVLGQLAEELFWKEFIAPLSSMSSRALAHLWSIDVALIKEGWELSFVPGHLIRDGAGKLTDMLLVATKKGEPVQRILGVFEIKAYEGGAAELRGVLQTTATGEAKTLATIDKELAAQIQYRAQIEFEERMAAAAQHPGVVPVPPAVAEIETRMMNEELRGTSQIMHDVDRLGAGQVVQILIDGRPTQVILDKAVRFFAVAPAEAKSILTAGGEAVEGAQAVTRAFEGAEAVLTARGYPTFFWALKVSRSELDLMVQAINDIGVAIGKL